MKIVVAIALAVLLASCASSEKRQPAFLAAADNAFCSEKHAIGSPDYVECRKAREKLFENVLQ